MADLSKTVELIFKSNTSAANTGIDQLEQNLAGVGGAAQGAAPGVQNLENQVEQLGTQGGQFVGGLVDAFKTLAAAVVVKEFIDANVEAERFERSMTLLKGSTEAAAEEFQYIKDLSNTLGLELFSTADAYVNLTAATKGTALEGQATRDIFEAVATAMSSLGKSSADTEGALLAISQMVSKGTVSMEELRGQLGERLPGAFQVAATAMGVTTEQLVDMVSKGDLAASDFLPRFAQALKDTYGDVAPVETFEAAWNRMHNSIQEAFVTLGQSGAIDVFVKGVEIATLTVVGAVAGMELLGGTLANLAYTLTSLDFSGYQERQNELLSEYATKVAGARAAVLELDAGQKDLAYSGEQAGAAITTGMKDSALSTEDLKKATKEVDGLLKQLGVDPKAIRDPVLQAAADITAAFEKLVANPAVTGQEILAAALTNMEKLTGVDLDAMRFAIEEAFNAGKLSADEYAAAINALDTKEQGLWAAMVVTTDATKKQADELKRTEEAARKAEEAAQKYAIEMEKIASNERIKLIEASINLEIAELEANAQVAEAIINSLAETYSAETQLISDLLGGLTENANTASDRIKIDFAKAAEERVEELHDAQMLMIDAQVAYLRAKTDQMAAGNPLITVQGDGLAPHLESIMWEIFRQVQIKMAYDGGDMLVGGCTL